MLYNRSKMNMERALKYVQLKMDLYRHQTTVRLEKHKLTAKLSAEKNALAAALDNFDDFECI